MYCVKFENAIKPYFGFFRPYNAVRDNETYSLTYLPPSVLNGIENSLDIPLGSIVRHKLTFNKGKMDKELVKTTYGTKWIDKKPYISTIEGGLSGFHIKHALINPVMVFGFGSREAAEVAYNSTIYAGQMEYMIYPSGKIFELTEEEFDALPGVETFESDENGVDCGFNRFKNNEPMFVDINRVEW